MLAEAETGNPEILKRIQNYKMNTEALTQRSLGRSCILYLKNKRPKNGNNNGDFLGKANLHDLNFHDAFENHQK